MSQFFKKQKGFSLLEVIIAVFVITVGLLAVLGLINFLLNSAQSSKDNLVAAELAQEGVEIVRSMRDSQDDWTAWFQSPPVGNWQVQYNTDNSHPLVAYSGSNYLKYDSASGLYQYSVGENTQFLRKVTISKISDNQAKVSVDISWKFKGSDRHFILEDRLWRWQ